MNMPSYTLKEWQQKAYKEVHGYQVHDILRDWEANIKAHIFSAEGYEQRIEELMLDVKIAEEAKEIAVTAWENLVESSA